MARGRKRKPGVKRKPNGRIDQRFYEDPRIVVLRQRRKAEAKRLSDPLYGYPLGQLLIEGYLEPRLGSNDPDAESMFEAGCAWAALAWRYSQMKGLMLPMCRAIDWEGPQGRALASEPTPEQVESLEGQYQAAVVAIQRSGNGVMGELRRVLLGDEWPSRMGDLRAGLSALAEWRNPKKGRVA